MIVYNAVVFFFAKKEQCFAAEVTKVKHISLTVTETR